MLREENKIKTKKKERTKHRFEKGTCKPMLPGSTFNQTLAYSTLTLLVNSFSNAGFSHSLPATQLTEL